MVRGLQDWIAIVTSKSPCGILWQIVCPWHGLEAASCQSHATMKLSRADQANLTTGGLGVAEGGWETAVSGSSRDLRTQKWHSDRLSLSVSFAC